MPKDEFLKPEIPVRKKMPAAQRAKRVAELAGLRNMNEVPPTTIRCRGLGIALLIAMLVIVTLSGLALSMVLLTASQIRLGQTLQAQGKVYYDAMAGMEEVRGRMNSAAPDTIALSLPTTLQQVLYVVNSTSSDPVQPTHPASPYYDFEYRQEFSGGLGSVTVLAPLTSDQPGAGTSTSIPYKWVRITLKTTDGTSPLYWDGTQQTTNSTGNTLVYVLTALAVDSTKVRKILQTDVASTPGSGSTAYAAVAAVAAAGSANVLGKLAGLFQLPNITLTGNDTNVSGTQGCPPRQRPCRASSPEVR